MAALYQDVAAVLVEKATNTQAELIEATPVDTSFLQSNWQLTVGEPAEGTVPIGGSIADLTGYQLKDGSIFITDNAEYARAVNSRGKHAGFVEAAVARGLAKP